MRLALVSHKLIVIKSCSRARHNSLQVGWDTTYYPPSTKEHQTRATYGHQQEHQYLHVTRWDPYLPAVILGNKAQIIGFKVGGCSSDNTLSHVMRIDHLQPLLTANLSFPDRDIRFRL